MVLLLPLLRNVLVDQRKSLLEWEAIVESVSKSYIPIDFISSIEFLYPGNSITLAISDLSKDELKFFGRFIDSTALKDMRINFNMDQIRSVVTEIRESYLSKV